MQTRLILAVIPLATALVWGAVAWAGPPRDDAEREVFLLNAKTVERSRIETGVTESIRAVLTDGETTHAAHVQRVDRVVSAKAAPDDDGELADCFRHNVAAYRVDRMIGLNAAPVSVLRPTLGTRAAVTWWVDDVAMTTAEFHARRLEPPDRHDWNHQFQAIRVLQELIYNRDPNRGNLLVTDGWKLVPIDFSRSFSPNHHLREPEKLTHVCPRLRRGLMSLTEPLLSNELKGLLTKRQIRALLIRRDLLLERVATLDAETKGRALTCYRPMRNADMTAAVMEARPFER